MIQLADPLRGHSAGFAWDVRTARYHYVNSNGRIGKFISQRDLNATIVEIHDRQKKSLRGLVSDALDGRISLGTAQDAFAMLVRNNSNLQVSVAVGGWSNVSASQWGSNGAGLRRQYAYINNFFNQVNSGEITPEQALARAETYADYSYRRYWEELTDMKLIAGYTQARLYTAADDRVCPICSGSASRGWLSIDSFELPPLHNACRCWVDYR